MNTSAKLGTKEDRPRLLVAMASFGEKNLAFLKRIIRTYLEMPMQVDVVVFSNAPKNLGAGVKVIVGLPSPNPWSLPFAHKNYFAENVERYDLFIYSEDDMEVTWRNLQAFLRVTPALPADEIAGFLRYETDRSGAWHVPEAHAAAHWKTESVRRRGNHIVAEFSNEHAALYLLTRDQLRKAIASGGFLRGPCEGRYDMLCTAATDPYTNCGFRKVICISTLEDFLIHHLPDRYIGQFGLPLSALQEQVKTLMEIVDNRRPAGTFCRVESRLLNGRWSKCFDEPPRRELSEMLPRETQTVLSVGCGMGGVEPGLVQRGVTVTALPLDSVVGAAVQRKGLEVIGGTWNEAAGKLTGRKFDCVLLANLLHLQPDPARFLQCWTQFVGERGVLLLAGPNFNRLPLWLKRNFGANGCRKLGDYAASGINLCGPATLIPQIKRCGLGAIDVRWLDQELSRGRWTARVPLGFLTARNWILRAGRTSNSTSFSRCQ